MDEYNQMDDYYGYDYPAVQPVAPAGAPVSYDDFGSPVYDPAEEERRRREVEQQILEYQRQQEGLANEVSRKQEITTYGDGSHTVKTTQEIPAGQRQNMETGEMYTPVGAAPQQQPVAYRAPQPAPQQPVAPYLTPAGIDQSQYTQRQESGGQPGIGYHYPVNQQGQRQSTAYGAYGITGPAYQDVQRANPKFAGRPIESLSQDEQREAYQTYTGLNAQALQRNGVEPTPANQRLAHLLGARGAADFLRDGTLSPQAARANGGFDRLRQIALARLQGSNAPASGAARQNLVQGEQGGVPSAPAQLQPVAPGAPAQGYPADNVINDAVAAAEARPKMEPNSYDEFGTPVYSQAQADLDSNLKSYEAIQNDPKALMNFSSPYEWMNTNARLRAADIMSTERDNAKAEEKLKTATETDLAKYLRGKKDDDMSNRIRGMLFALAGNKEMANYYAMKLDKVGTDKYVQGSDGKPYLVKTRADGEIIGGYNAETGAKLSEADMVKVGAGVQSQKGVHQSADVYKDPSGKVKGSFVLETRPGQTPVYKEVGTGRVATAEESAVLNKTGVAGTLDTQRAAQIQRQNIQLAGDWAKLQMRVQGAAPEAANRYIGEFNAKHGTNFGLQNIAGTAPQIDMATGQMVQEAPTAQAPAQAAPAQRPAPAARPAVGQTPADIESARRAEEERRKATLEVGTAAEKDYVTKFQPEVGQTASDGQSVANARRQQLDIIKSNPSIVNIMNGQGTQYDQARRIIINAVSGAYGNEERQQLAQDLGQVMNKLTEAEQGALQEFVNLNTVVNSKTLRANAGPGAVSDAEQRANKEANVGNVDRIPAYSALAGLHRSQFSGDLAASKQAFLAANPQIKTTAEFNTAWQRQEALRLREYQAIAKARFDVMGPAPSPNAGPEAIKAYRDRVFRAFEAYPAPTFDPATNKWNYQTANARRAAMSAVLGQ